MTSLATARSEANALFKAGDLVAAVAAYEKALLEAPVGAERLTLLSNLGLCNMKLSTPRVAADRLAEALRMHVVCYANPGLAAKVAARLMQACEALGDEAGRRAALSDCRIYLSVPGVTAPSGLSLPEPPAREQVVSLLSTIGSANPDDEGLESVREVLASVPGEALDDNRIHALILSIHVASMREEVEWGLALVRLMLDSGVPVDARSENCRTPLMIASNSARADLVEIFLAAGADAKATDGEGFSALHAAVADIADHPVERLCEIVRLLSRAGAHLDALNGHGLSALMCCANVDAKEGSESAVRVAAALLEAGASTRVRSAAHHGFSAYDLAVDRLGRDSPLASLLREHAESYATAPHASHATAPHTYLTPTSHSAQDGPRPQASALRPRLTLAVHCALCCCRYSTEARVGCRQSDLTFAWRTYLEGTLKPCATPAAKVQRLAAAAGLQEADTYCVAAHPATGVVANPLLLLWTSAAKALPRALTKARHDGTLVTESDEAVNELRLLLGKPPTSGAKSKFQLEPQPWLVQARAQAKGTAAAAAAAAATEAPLLEPLVPGLRRFVPRAAFADFREHVQAPLQRQCVPPRAPAPRALPLAPEPYSRRAPLTPRRPRPLRTQVRAGRAQRRRLGGARPACTHLRAEGGLRLLERAAAGARRRVRLLRR